jgi:hypothetical protein
MPVERFRYIGFSHFEADKRGSLNELLAVASAAMPLCGKIAALVSVNDIADREARAMEGGAGSGARRVTAPIRLKVGGKSVSECRCNIQ